MKLLLENWNKLLNEYSRPYSDPSKVKIVSDVLYYSVEGGRLFLVAEFELFVGGPKKKFGFYTSRGESVAGTEDTAGSWVPAVGIKEDSGWIMKIPGKYPHPDSLLGMVGKKLGKLFPIDKQKRTRQAKRREFMATIMGPRGARFSSEDKNQKRESEVQKQIKDINEMFKSQGVYDISPRGNWGDIS